MVIATMIGAVMLAPAVFTSAEEATPSVVINEVAWAGSSVDSDDEWIELKNTDDEPIDITGWKITRANSINSSNTIVIFEEGTVIPTSGFLLISRFHKDNSVLNVDSIVVGEKMTLADSDLRLRLWQLDAEACIDELVDITQSSDDKNKKITTERTLDITGWQSSTSINHHNFDDPIDDTKNYGTPGADNSVPLEPPTITAFTPNSIERGKQLEAVITGTNFDKDLLPTQVTLERGDVSVGSEEITVSEDGTQIQALFNTSNLAVGWWDVVVMEAILQQAVEVMEPPPNYDLTTTVRINEAYPQPNTTSNDEFIELYNFGEKTVDLKGWILDDVRNGGSSEFVLDGRNILPKSYLTIYKSESKLTMNDSGDDVYLLQPNGFELDHTAYTEAPRGQTWSRFDDGWKWTNSPTPNGKNIFSTPPAQEDESTPVDEPDDTPVENPTFEKGDVVISELLPNPVEDDEFIELYNNSSSPIDLKNWVLQDKSKHKYKVSDFAITIQTTSALTVQAGQYVVITEKMSGIALNNSGGEIVTLYDPSGNVVATVSYVDKAPSGAAYAWEDGMWTWTKTPTPGQVNILGLDEADEAPPAVDILMPDSLPVTGKQNQRWMGFGLISLGLSAIVFWNYAKHRYPQSD